VDGGTRPAVRLPVEQLMKILVVDHEKVNRANLADKLAAHGHEPVTASDGQEALDRLLGETYDIVFVDAKVPKVEGIELLRQIKQGPARTRRS